MLQRSHLGAPIVPRRIETVYSACAVVTVSVQLGVDHPQVTEVNPIAKLSQ